MRLRAGLTQKEVASEINIALTKYNYIESGKFPMNKDIATKLSAVFSCEVP